MDNQTYMFNGMEIDQAKATEISTSLKAQVGEKQYRKLLKYAKFLNQFNLSDKMLKKAVVESSQTNKITEQKDLTFDDMSEMIQLMCIIAKFE